MTITSVVKIAKKYSVIFRLSRLLFTVKVQFNFEKSNITERSLLEKESNFLFCYGIFLLEKTGHDYALPNNYGDWPNAPFLLSAGLKFLPSNSAHIFDLPRLRIGV